MNWQEALGEICSVEFDVSLNVVSGTNSYFRAAAQHPAVQEAYRRMFESGDVREEVIGLIYDLAGEPADPQFENPNDTALAILLWLTNFTAPDVVESAATRIDQTPHCWYAKKLAQRILNPPPSLTANHLSSPEPEELRITGSSSGSTHSAITLTLGPPRTFRPSKPDTRSSVADTIWSAPSITPTLGPPRTFRPNKLDTRSSVADTIWSAPSNERDAIVLGGGQS